MSTTIKGVQVTDGQAAVYGVLKTFGPMPDHALVPLAQHAANVHLSSSGIRSRRAELYANGLVADTGRTIKTGSGRNAHVWEAV
jgi:hypothetical protein